MIFSPLTGFASQKWLRQAPTRNVHVQEERGQRVEMSEEDLYSGVIRDGEPAGSSAGASNKYTIPGRRKEVRNLWSLPEIPSSLGLIEI